MSNTQDMNQDQPMLEPKIWLLIVIVVIAAILRVLFSEMPNFTPVAAMALFAGTYFRKKAQAFLVPIGLMLLSDIILEIGFMTGLREFSGFHGTMIFVYTGFAAMVLIGTVLRKKVNIATVIGAGLVSSLLFFLVTNFGVWVMDAGRFYPMTLTGLVECYVAGIPFFRHTLLGDMVFVAIFFGGFELMKANYPRIALAKAA